MEYARYSYTAWSSTYVADSFRGSTPVFNGWNTISYNKFKVSNDDGCFTPGVYRVNPYSIADGVDLGSLDAGLIERGSYSATWYWNLYCFNGAPSVKHMKYALETVPLPSTDAYRQLALQKAQGKVGSADLALGEDIGELRETISMLREPMSALKKFFSDDGARNLRLLIALAKQDKREVALLLGRTGKASIEAMTSTWLEIRYGLRPLCYLLLDAMEKVYADAKPVWDGQKIRSAKSTLTFEETDKVYNCQTVLYGNMDARGDVRIKDVVTVSASVQYRQKCELSLLDQLGLTPRHLPETAWNLTRASFVVDWLLSIGPWLATLRLNPGVTVLGNTVSTKIERKCNVDFLEAGDRAYPETFMRIMFKNADGSTRFIHDEVGYNRFDRVVGVDLSYQPHFTWGRTLDLWKALDTISLLWQPLASKLGKKK